MYTLYNIQLKNEHCVKMSKDIGRAAPHTHTHTHTHTHIGTYVIHACMHTCTHAHTNQPQLFFNISNVSFTCFYVHYTSNIHVRMYIHMCTNINSQWLHRRHARRYLQGIEHIVCKCTCETRPKSSYVHVCIITHNYTCTLHMDCTPHQT